MASQATLWATNVAHKLLGDIMSLMGFLLAPSFFVLIALCLSQAVDHLWKDRNIERVFPLLIVLQTAHLILAKIYLIKSEFFQLGSTEFLLSVSVCFYLGLHYLIIKIRGEEWGQRQILELTKNLCLLLFLSLSSNPELLILFVITYFSMDIFKAKFNVIANIPLTLSLVAAGLFSIPYLLSLGAMQDGAGLEKNFLSFVFFLFVGFSPMLFVLWKSVSKVEITSLELIRELGVSTAFTVICLVRYAYPYLNGMYFRPDLKNIYIASIILTTITLLLWALIRNSLVNRSLIFFYLISVLAICFEMLSAPQSQMEFALVLPYFLLASLCFQQLLSAGGNFSSCKTLDKLYEALSNSLGVGAAYLFGLSLLIISPSISFRAVENFFVRIPLSLGSYMEPVEFGMTIANCFYAALQAMILLCLFREYFPVPSGERIVLRKYYANVELILLNILILLGFLSTPLYKYIAF